MEDNKSGTLNTGSKQEDYLIKIFRLLTARESFVISSERTHFNKTEIRLISEVLLAGYEKKRVFSTQLAKILGVTRSAVSHTVQRLEEKGVIKRVQSEQDKKVDYIEIADEILDVYDADLQKCKQFVGEIVEEFGETDFYQMCTLYEKFVRLAQTKLKNKERK